MFMLRLDVYKYYLKKHSENKNAIFALFAPLLQILIFCGKITVNINFLFIRFLK